MLPALSHNWPLPQLPGNNNTNSSHVSSSHNVPDFDRQFTGVVS